MQRSHQSFTFDLSVEGDTKQIALMTQPIINVSMCTRRNTRLHEPRHDLSPTH